MVWYVPPLSPVMSMIEGDGAEADPDDVFPAIDQLRIPVQFLANLLSAGDEEVIRTVLKRLAAMRSYMRTKTVGGDADPAIAESVGMTPHEVEEMYRLLGLAKSIDRFVIPKSHAEVGGLLDDQQGACGFKDPAGPGPCGPAVEAEYGATRVQDGVAAFHLGSADAPMRAAVSDPPPPSPHGGCGCGDGGCGSTPATGMA